MSSSTSSPTSEPLAVARVMGVRGLAGDLRVMVLTDDPDRLAAGERVIVDGESTARTIVLVGSSKHGPVIRLSGIDDRGQAAALIGRHLSAPEGGDPLPLGSYWWHELEGLVVVDEAGNPVGRLEEVFRAGGNEVYRVVGPSGEILVPALKSVVVGLDVPGGTMTIRDPATWLEEV